MEDNPFFPRKALAQLAASVRTQLGVEDLMDSTDEVSSFDDELSTCATSSGTIEQDIINAHRPSTSTEAEEMVDISDDEEDAEISAAASAPSSREILQELRVILASASVSEGVLYHVGRAEELLTEDILRSKMAATRQQTITEMFGQRQ